MYGKNWDVAVMSGKNLGDSAVLVEVSFYHILDMMDLASVHVASIV